MIRLILRILLILVSLAALAAVFCFAVLVMPSFEGWRQSVAETALSTYLDRETKVSGNVEIFPGWRTQVVLTDIQVKDASWTTSDHVQKIGRAGFSVPTIPLLLGNNPELTGLVFENVKINLEIDAEGKSNFSTTSSDDEISDPLVTLTDFLQSDVARDFSLRSLEFLFRDQSTGWGATNKIEALISKENKDDNQLAIDGKGTFNGKAVSLSVRMQLPEEGSDKAADLPFTLGFAIPGSNTALNGTIDISPDIASIDAKINSKSDSIGDLLTALEIERSVEGTGGISGVLNGPLNALSFKQIDSSATLENGQEFKLTGSVANMATSQGLDLKFSGKLPVPKADQVTKSSLYDLTITGFSGALVGDGKQAVIRDFNLETDSFDANLREIGPITVDKVVRDEEGRVGLEGVRVVAGPIDKPFVEVTGSLSDALQLKGFKFSGKIDVESEVVFGFDSSPTGRDLGTLRGTIAFSDADGDFGLEELEAQVVNSSLLNLNVSLAIDDIRRLDDIAFKIGLHIADLQKFASVLDVKLKKVGGIKFDGKVAGGSGDILASGDAVFGKTKISGKLKGVLLESGAKLSGSLRTPLLHLADIANITEVQELVVARARERLPEQVEKIEKSKFKQNAEIKMVLKADKIDGAGKAASNFEAHVDFKDDIARINPFTARYLGGQITSDVTANLKGKVPALKFKGTMKNWNIGRTLKQMGHGGILTGIVHVNYNLSTRGDSTAVILDNLNGKLSVHLRNGTIGTTLIDLSAMSLPSWLFSGSSSAKGTSKIVCAIVPMSFKNGRGNINPLVLETENVQIVGKGYVDFNKDTINIRGNPVAKRAEIAAVSTPFTVTGKLSNPQVNLEKGAGAAKVVGETLLLPLNLLGTLFQSDSKDEKAAKAVPCKVLKASGKAAQPGQKVAPEAKKTNTKKKQPAVKRKSNFNKHP